MNNRGDTYCYLLDSAGSRCLLGQGGLAKLASYKKRKLYIIVQGIRVARKMKEMAAAGSSAAAR